MKFSVIITSYNQPGFLKEAIESVFDQTYKESFECIIINDSSEKTCMALNLKDSRPEIKLIYIENEKNLGLQKSYNIGAFYATGEYIIRLDGDDKLLPQTLDILDKYIDNLKDEKIAFLYSDLKIMGTDVIRIYPEWTSGSIIDLEKIGHLQIVKRKVSEQIGHWDIFLSYSADTDFIIRLIEAGYKIKHIPEVLVENRLHESQYTQQFIKQGNNPQIWKKLIFERALAKRPDLWLESYQNILMQTTGSSLWRSEAEFVNKYVKGLANGVDLGCSYRKKYPFAIGIDMDRNKGKVPDIVWNVEEELLFRDKTLDYIISSHIIEHLENPVKTIKEWLVKLKIGGILIFVVPDTNFTPKMGTPEADKTHKHDFVLKTFKEEVLDFLNDDYLKVKLENYDILKNNWSFGGVIRRMQ